MKIGIIVYSRTNNTYAVAQMLKEKLDSQGHAAVIERITVKGDASRGKRDFVFINAPSAEPYDVLVFGAPVQAFSLAPVMSAYIEDLGSLEGRKVGCFVTKQLPLPWTGGTQAVSKMKKLCEEKGAKVCGTEIIVWDKMKDQNILQCTENISKIM